MLQRIFASPLSVLPRRIAAVGSVRYIETGTGRGSQSKSFSQKEKAHEDQYIREKEKAKLEALRESVAKQQAELAELEKKVNGQKK
ncbi:hypothetical protein BS47DRAFT_206059 [Hydnum rufescens UP504]|uniref:ATPase inhibitor, mitochondrial n=1 Tax=Hydnum rufescens UP504 TaxID=1448309 RepID=A0A9P6AMX6_9AGAM|nr:hypothetical protein BS47DRAFT_206059 [Hydnum rufescens UP504]